jgi:hypothetical protein
MHLFKPFVASFYFLEVKEVVLIRACNQMLVGLVVIEAGLGREDHSSIAATAFGRGPKPLDVRTRPELWTIRAPFP